MAKWGEGDPRWIVEERPDATNVNNWHWSEKNATPWSKDRITKLFKNFAIEHDGEVTCRVVETEKIDGEATANNRKGKLIFFYEWNVVLKWEGTLVGDGPTYKGKATIPNLSEENELDEVEITITTDEPGDDSERLKQFMYNVGRAQIRKQVGVYLRELREEFSKGLILPRKDAGAPVKPDGVKNITSGFNKKVNLQPIESAERPPVDGKATSVGCKLDVKTIKFNETFQCRAKDLYDVFTKTELATAFTKSPAKVDASRGGDFLLFDGNISGKFEELLAGEKIVQTWRYKQWPSGHYSQVTMEFVEKVSLRCHSMHLGSCCAFWGHFREFFGSFWRFSHNLSSFRGLMKNI